jgi:hypothetical protein
VIKAEFTDPMMLAEPATFRATGSITKMCWLCQNCGKTPCVLAIGVSFQAKSRCPSYWNQTKIEGSERGLGAFSAACKAGALPAELHAHFQS